MRFFWLLNFSILLALGAISCGQAQDGESADSDPQEEVDTFNDDDPTVDTELLIFRDDEVCDNGEDDDLDGAVDCQDLLDCCSDPVCTSNPWCTVSPGDHVATVELESFGSPSFVTPTPRPGPASSARPS